MSIRRPFRSRDEAPPGLEPVVRVYVRNYLHALVARGGPAAVLSDLDPGNPLLRRQLLADGKVSPGELAPWLGAPTKKLVARLREACAGPPQPAPTPQGLVGRNLALIARCLGLSEAERSMLQLCLTVFSTGAFNALLMDAPRYRREDCVELAATLACVEPSAARQALSPDQVLCLSGLVGLMPDGHLGPLFIVDPRLLELVFQPSLQPEAVLSRFLAREPRAELTLDDYGARRGELGALIRVLEGWKRTRQPGLNFLFYGPTGVGKTEAARLVAREAGCELFLAAGAGRDAESPSARQRIASLGVGNALLKQAPAVLLFDELEDLAPGPFSFGGSSAAEAPPSKLWMNRLIENNAVPTVWTSNSLRAVDPAFLRRFALAVEFPALTERQRRSVWQHVAGAHLPAPELDVLAQAHDLSPGEISLAIRTAKVAGGAAVDRETLQLALEGAERVRGNTVRRAVRVGAEYRLEALNATRDLGALSERLCAWRPGPRAGMTLCLYGRSGTGKSEYVHYLARRMDRPLLVRNVSQLKSKWVGDTERNIAASFEQAQKEGAVLLFDEADTFLADRRAAMHEWERSQVNEFLQQLEACRAFVAVTTNLYKDLDPAVLRRFMFKVEFLAMKAEHRLTLFEARLGRFLLTPLSADDRLSVEAALRGMGELVPSDFGVVSRRLEVLDARADAAMLLRELSEEVASRRHDSARPIGFREAEPGWGSGAQVARAQVDSR